MIPLLTAHLWQSTFFAVAVGLLTIAFRKNRAQVRYWLWLSASLKFFVPFALLMGLGSALERWAPAGTQKLATTAASYTLEQFSEPLPYRESVASLPSTGETVHWIPVTLLVVWLAGFLTITLIRFRNWFRIRTAVRASTGIHVLTAVDARLSPGLLEPGVVGLFRPTLLLPEGITERLTPSELQTILAHELCHIRRRDNLFASIHMLVEAVFWFHPMVWWIGARLVEERERACDEEVLSLGNQPDVYADAILNVCKLYVESPLACVSGVSGASIRRRIEVIMSNRRAQRLNRPKRFLLAVAGTSALVVPVAIGLVIGVGNVSAIRARSVPRSAPVAMAPEEPIQTAQISAPQPQTTTPNPQPATNPGFDAASIKRCMPGDELTGTGGRGGGGGRGPRSTPGRLVIQCLDLATMIDMVYASNANDRPVNFSVSDPADKRFRGGPAWVYSDWYSIEAETDDPVANGLTQPGRTLAVRMLQGPMFQGILEDRFQLKLHRETEEVPMYALAVAKSGLKIKPLEAGCIQLDPTKEHHASDFAGPKPVCNTVIGGWNGPSKTWQVTGPLVSFAHNLSGILDRTVLDKTGIEGIFSIHLEYAPDENTQARRRPDGSLPPEPDPSDIPPGATIFTAVEQQLGLKLVADRGTQGFFVIDHVERPSEN